MSAQHTAGPLMVSDPVIVDGAPDHGIYVHIDGKRHIVAECFGRSGWGHQHASHANATLFAAAPDLLAALTGLLNEATRCFALTERGEQQKVGAMDKARAAIAKATGTTSAAIARATGASA